MINLGNMNIADLRLGASQVKAVYLGSEQIWSGEEPAPVGDWLCFTAEQTNSTVRLDKSGSPNTVSLETSTDGSNWTDYSWSGSIGDTLTLANVGDKVYMRAKNENLTFSSSGSGYYNFKMTGTIAASGNIQTLLRADGSRTDVPANAYLRLFYQCSSLVTAPQLKATKLNQSSYDAMFCWCTSLKTVPKILATTLGQRSFVYAFQHCRALSSLEVAFTTWTSGATDYWVEDVAASGTFTCPAELSDIRGVNNIPTGWTKASPAPDIFYNEAPTRVWYNDGTSAEYNIVGQATTSNVLSASQIEKIEFGNTVTGITGQIFKDSPNLKYFYTGWNCESLPSRVCNDATTLSSVVIGPSLKTINAEYAFSGAGPITDLVFHDDCQLSNIGSGAFNVAVSCDVLTIKSRASSIYFGHWAFNATPTSYSDRRVVNTFIFDVDVVPTADSQAFSNQEFCRGVAGAYAVVPDNLVAQWKTTSPWSSWASNIISMSEYEAIKNNS